MKRLRAFIAILLFLRGNLPAWASFVTITKRIIPRIPIPSKVVNVKSNINAPFTRSSTSVPGIGTSSSIRFSSNQDNTNDGDDSSMTSTSSLSKCPFSKTFPKYRIDLSSKSKEEREAERRLRQQQGKFTIPPSLSNVIKMPSILTDLQKGIDQTKFQQQYPNDVNTEWRDNQDGIDAFASLWKSAASMMVSLSSSPSSPSVVLAYPDCRTSVLQRWIDIFQWMQQQNEFNKSENCATLIEATLLEDGQTIRLSPTKKNNAATASMVSTTKIATAIDPSIIEKRMQAWVKRVLVEMTICPFTKSVTKSGQGLADMGVPVGKIAYHTSAASSPQICQLMADTWTAIADMIDAGPSGKEGISSILMAAPNFDDDFDLWAGPIFAMLEAGVVAAGAETSVGVVCFHPQYATPDGTSFPGFGHMHSVPRLQQWVKDNAPTQDLSAEDVAAGGAWQRRTPHATINVLRADQLEAAEGRRQSGIMYSENICKLIGKPDGVGNEKLTKDLERERNMN